jgi:hypothetical protein
MLARALCCLCYNHGHLKISLTCRNKKRQACLTKSRTITSTTQHCEKLWHLCWKIAENVVPAQSFLLMSLQVNAFDRSGSSFYQVEGGCPAQSCKLRCTGSMNCKLPKWSLCRETGETSCLSMYLTSWKQFPTTPDCVPAVQLLSADKVINYEVQIDSRVSPWQPGFNMPY